MAGYKYRVVLTWKNKNARYSSEYYLKTIWEALENAYHLNNLNIGTVWLYKKVDKERWLLIEKEKYG